MSSKENKNRGAFFGSTEKELKQFMIGPGEVTIGPDTLTFGNYPFPDSLAYGKATIHSKDIVNICIKSAPPAIRVNNELIFVSAEYKEALINFANHNEIPLSERFEIWDWILQPFLDTEFTEEDKERLYGLLNRYGLDRNTVDRLRTAVKEQMLKYNFDTMLWEWGYFGAFDVLCAMSPKLDPPGFSTFYKEVMEIALRTDV